jgi:hypothetical protein
MDLFCGFCTGLGRLNEYKIENYSLYTNLYFHMQTSHYIGEIQLSFLALDMNKGNISWREQEGDRSPYGQQFLVQLQRRQHRLATVR